jgi:hypothetical protein
MHTVELLDEAMALARKLGYDVRLEAVEGSAGSCVVAGRKLLFVDVAASPAERLETVLDVLGEEAGASAQPNAWATSPTLRKLVGRRAA